jgi:hypothetical protein
MGGIIDPLKFKNCMFDFADCLTCLYLLHMLAPLNEERASKDISGTTEGPFLAFFQPVTKGLIKTKSNLQLIDIPNKRYSLILLPAQIILCDTFSK